MSSVRKIQLPDNTTVDINDSRVYVYRTVTGTAAVTETPFYCSRWDVTDETVTQYTDGMVVCLKVPVAGNGTYGTGFQINNLGYKPVVYNVSSMVSTRYGVGSVVWAVYNSTQTASLYLNSDSATTVTGCWQVNDYGTSDTNSIGYQLRTNSSVRPTVSRTRYYRILFSSADNTKWVPANTKYDNSATSVKPVNTTPINPFGRIVYMSGTTNVTAGSNVGAGVTWDQYALTLGYSFNTTGSALTLTYPAPVYVKCEPQADGSAIIDSTTPYVQALPSTADGKIYIYLGQAYSETQVEMTYNHPVLYHDGSKITIWTGAAAKSDVFVCTFNSANNTMDKTPQEIYEAYQVGKFIICVDTPYYLKLTYITPQSSSYLIHFESIHLAGYGSYEIRYISYNTSTWLSSTDSIQQGLVSGTNIKTINNESLLGSGDISVGDNVLVCNYNSTNNTVDKTFQEIAAARNAGKVVICILSNEVYYLVTLSETSNTICFVHITSSMTPSVLKYLKFANNSWTSYIINIQDYLVSGTNIKTINGNSVLGSGNITIQGGSSTLSGLTDTTITTPSDGQVLTYDNATSKWVNGDVPTEVLMCTLTASGTSDPNTGEWTMSYSCDKTDAEIYAAYVANKSVLLKVVGEDHSWDTIAPETYTIYRLACAQSSTGGNNEPWYFFSFQNATSAFFEVLKVISTTVTTILPNTILSTNFDRISGDLSDTSFSSVTPGWYFFTTSITRPQSGTDGNLAEIHANGEYGDSGIASTDVSTAITNSHTHSNKTILDYIPSTLGTAGQVLRVNSGATGLEFGTVSGGLTNYDFTHTANTTVSGSTTTVTFAANTRGSAMLTISADLGLTIACSNGSDNYIWVKNTGSSEVDITISGVIKNSTNVSNVYVPSDGITVPAGGLCEIGIIVNTDGAFITSRNDLAL